MSRFVSQAVAIPVTENISPITSRFTNRCLYTTPGAYTFTVPSGVCSITAVAVGPGAKQCEILTEIDISVPMTNLTRTVTYCTSTPMTLCSVLAGGPTTCAHRQCNSIVVCACHNHSFYYYAYYMNSGQCPQGAQVGGNECGNGYVRYKYAYLPAGAGGGYAEKTVSTSPGCTFCVIVGNHCGTNTANTPFSCVENTVCATGLRVVCSNCYTQGFNCFKTPSDFMECRTTTLGASSASSTYTQTGDACYSFTKCCYCVVPGCGFGGDINRVGGNNICYYCAMVATGGSNCLLWYRCFCCVEENITCKSCYFYYGNCSMFQRMQNMKMMTVPWCDFGAGGCAGCDAMRFCGCMGVGVANIQPMTPGTSVCGACQAFEVFGTCTPNADINNTLLNVSKCTYYRFCWNHQFTNLGNVCSFSACAPGTFDLTCGGSHFNHLCIVEEACLNECFSGMASAYGVISNFCHRTPFAAAHTIISCCPPCVCAMPFYKFGGSSAGNYYGNGVSAMSDAGTSYTIRLVNCDMGQPCCHVANGCVIVQDNRCALYDSTVGGAGGYCTCSLMPCGGPTWTQCSGCAAAQVLAALVAGGCYCNEPSGNYCFWCAYDFNCGTIGTCTFVSPSSCSCWYTWYNTPCHFAYDWLNWYAYNENYCCRCNNCGIGYSPCDATCKYMMGISPWNTCYTCFSTLTCDAYNEDICRFGFEKGPLFNDESTSDTMPLIVHQQMRGPIKPRVTRLIDSAITNWALKGDHFTVTCCFLFSRTGGSGCFHNDPNRLYLNNAYCASYGCTNSCAVRANPWTRYNYYGTCYDNHNNFYRTVYGQDIVGCHCVCVQHGQPAWIVACWQYGMSYCGTHQNYPCCLGYNFTTAACKPTNQNPLINVYDYICTKMMNNRNQTDSASEACLILCNWKGWFDHNKYTLGISCFNNFLSALYAACSTYNSSYCCVFKSIDQLQVSDPLFGIGQVHEMGMCYQRQHIRPNCYSYSSDSPCCCCSYCGFTTPVTPPRCNLNSVPLVYTQNCLKCNTVCLCCNPECYNAQGGAGTATAGTWASSQSSCTLVCTTGGCICCIAILGTGCSMSFAPVPIICCTCGGVGAILRPTILGSPCFGFFCNVPIGLSGIACTSGYLAGIEISCGGNGYMCAPTLCFCFDCSWIYCRNTFFSNCSSTFSSNGCSNPSLLACCCAAGFCPCTCVYIAPSCSVYCCVTAYQSLGSGGGACSGVNNVPKCIDVVDSSIIKSVRPGRGGRGNEVDYEPYYYSYPGISAQLAVPIAPCCYTGDATASGCNWFDTPQIRGSGGNGTFTSAYLACIPAQGPGPGGGGPVGCDGNSCPLGTGGVLAGGGGCCGAGGYGGGAGWCGTPGTGMVVIYWNA